MSLSTIRRYGRAVIAGMLSQVHVIKSNGQGKSNKARCYNVPKQGKRAAVAGCVRVSRNVGRPVHVVLLLEPRTERGSVDRVRRGSTNTSGSLYHHGLSCRSNVYRKRYIDETNQGLKWRAGRAGTPLKIPRLGAIPH